MPAVRHNPGVDPLVQLQRYIEWLIGHPVAELSRAQRFLRFLVDLVRQAKRERLERSALLRRLARLPGVYVPRGYVTDATPEGWLVPRARPGYPERVESVWVRELRPEHYPPAPPLPVGEITHDRLSVEIMRGCTRGCRFCQAGMVFRPVRERPLDEVLAAVGAVMRDTGFEEISFLSLSSSDYSRIGELVGEVVARHGDEKLSIGLPSLRIETFSAELMDKLEKGRRRSGFTFAPEAATDRLRDVINKPIATEALQARLGQTTLLDARAHPERWPNLMVKVAGFSARFVDLSEQEKDESIARTMQRI